MIDSPPLQALSEAAILSTLVDGTIVVVSAGRTRRNAVRGAVKALRGPRRADAGVVLNRLSQRDENAYYAYGRPTTRPLRPARGGGSGGRRRAREDGVRAGRFVIDSPVTG